MNSLISMDNSSISAIANQFSLGQLLSYYRFTITDLADSYQILSNQRLSISIIKPPGIDNNVLIELNELHEISKVEIFLRCIRASSHSALANEAEAIMCELPLDLPPIIENISYINFLTHFLKWEHPGDLQAPFDTLSFKGKIFLQKDSMIFPLYANGDLANFISLSKGSLLFYNNRSEAIFQSAYNKQSLAVIASNPISLQSFLQVQNPNDFLSILAHPDLPPPSFSMLIEKLSKKEIFTIYADISGSTVTDAKLFSSIISFLTTSSDSGFALISNTHSTKPSFLLKSRRDCKLKEAFSFINSLDNELDSHFNDLTTPIQKDVTFQNGFRLDYQRIESPSPTFLLTLPQNPKIWGQFFTIISSKAVASPLSIKLSC